MILSLEKSFKVGEDTYASSVSPNGKYGVAFEDNLETGYFYALTLQPQNKVVDALHIYNVNDVIDKDIISIIKIAWTEDGMIASLLINNYCHAIYDFKYRGGYCRNAFPQTYSNWMIAKERHLTDDLIKKIFTTDNF